MAQACAALRRRRPPAARHAISGEWLMRRTRLFSQLLLVREQEEKEEKAGLDRKAAEWAKIEQRMEKINAKLASRGSMTPMVDKICWRWFNDPRRDLEPESSPRPLRRGRR